MPYYRAAGDYYRSRGDFFKKLKKRVGKLAKVMPVASAMAGGIGHQNALGTLSQGMSFMPGGMPAIPQGGLGSSVGALLGGLLGSSDAGRTLGGMFDATQPGDSAIIPDILEIPLERAGLNEMRGKKRRTMNAANVGALRRALRRVDSFRNLAKKSGALPAAKRLPPQRTCAHK